MTDHSSPAPPAKWTPTPSDALDMLAIAGEFETGMQKMIACGYEEYGPEPQRKHRLIIEALRFAGHSALSALTSPGCKP